MDETITECCNCIHFKRIKVDGVIKEMCDIDAEVSGNIMCPEFMFNIKRFKFEELTNMKESKRRIKRY